MVVFLRALQSKESTELEENLPNINNEHRPPEILQ